MTTAKNLPVHNILRQFDTLGKEMDDASTIQNLSQRLNKYLELKDRLETHRRVSADIIDALKNEGSTGSFWVSQQFGIKANDLSILLDRNIDQINQTILKKSP